MNQKSDMRAHTETRRLQYSFMHSFIYSFFFFSSFSSFFFFFFSSSSSFFFFFCEHFVVMARTLFSGEVLGVTTGSNSNARLTPGPGVAVSVSGPDRPHRATRIARAAGL